MEQVNDESGHLQHPSLLGFFRQKHYDVYRNLSAFGYTTPPRPEFIATSDEGSDLKDGKWGSLDESLSFLNVVVHIVGSSNGFLLCKTDLNENRKYIICNPVTREFKILPELDKAYRYVTNAFICKGDPNVSLDVIRYEVIRVGVSSFEQSTMLDMDTFSSESGEWKESSISSTTPFRLLVCNLPALILEELIVWRCTYTSIIVYDPARESVEVTNFPVNATNMICLSDCLSQSEGKIYFAQNDNSEIEIWVLDDCHGGQWTMKHRVNFTTLAEQNPEMGRLPGSFIVGRHMHPRDSQQIMLLISGRPFWYNLGTGKVNDIRGSKCMNLADMPFLYEWPLEAIHVH